MIPALSIIMPCYERAHFLRSVLEAYARQEGSAPFEIIAIDDGSRDNTPQLLSQFKSSRFELKQILLDRNAGPANARNHGISQARAPIVLFVGDDIMPNTSFVQQHLDAHTAHPTEEWAVLGKTTWPDDMLQNTLMRHIDGLGAQQFSYYYMKDGQEMDFRHFYTSNISLKRKLLYKVQPWFDTGFRYAAFEDVELGYRLATQVGMRICYNEQALTRHYHYYTIWGFSQRQYRAGMMSAVFVQKYPHMRRQLQFLRVRVYSTLARMPDVAVLIRNVPDEQLAQVEDLALYLASYYELNNIQPLDSLYLLMLNYYVLKGMIDADLPECEAQRAKKALLIVSYSHHIWEIIKTIKAQGLDYPQDICLSLQACLNCIQIPLISAGRKFWTTPYANSIRRMLGPGYET